MLDIVYMTYEEFIAEQEDKYHGSCECAMPGCDKPAYYEGGDSRCWFPVCEEHYEMNDKYLTYLRSVLRKIETRMKWDKSDSSLMSMYVRVLAEIYSRRKHSV